MRPISFVRNIAQHSTAQQGEENALHHFVIRLVLYVFSVGLEYLSFNQYGVLLEQLFIVFDLI